MLEWLAHLFGERAPGSWIGAAAGLAVAYVAGILPQDNVDAAAAGGILVAAAFVGAVVGAAIQGEPKK